MTVQITKTIKEEVEFTFPAYYKTKYSTYTAFLSLDMCISLYMSRDEKLIQLNISQSGNSSSIQEAFTEGQPISADEIYIQLERAQALQNAAILHAA